MFLCELCALCVLSVAIYLKYPLPIAAKAWQTFDFPIESPPAYQMHVPSADRLANGASHQVSAFVSQ